MGAPTVLGSASDRSSPRRSLTVSGYRFGRKWHDPARGGRGADSRGLPTLEHWITMDGAEGIAPGNAARHDWATLLSGRDRAAPEMLPFDHPLWVVYSSGTTGSPKPIVHGHGGVVLELAKLVGLHCDVGGPEDTFAWYSSTGWIMWNVQLGGLLTGATIALGRGEPGHARHGPASGALPKPWA